MCYCVLCMFSWLLSFPHPLHELRQSERTCAHELTLTNTYVSPASAQASAKTAPVLGGFRIKFYLKRLKADTSEPSDMAHGLHLVNYKLCICLLYLCGPSNNFHYSGHFKNIDDDDDDDERVAGWLVTWCE